MLPCNMMRARQKSSWSGNKLRENSENWLSVLKKNEELWYIIFIYFSACTFFMVLLQFSKVLFSIVWFPFFLPMLISHFRVDTFTVESPNIGSLTRVRIRHDNKGVAAGWFLSKVSHITRRLFWCLNLFEKLKRKTRL